MEAEGRRAHGTAQEPCTSPAAGGGEGARPQETRKRRSTWTAEEDAVLVAYVRAYGAGNWDQVPMITGLARPGRSCRFRWINSLQPGLKRGVAFSRDEELHLCRLHAAFGNKWARIAAQMEGRSENEVMTYWFSYVRRRQQAGLNVYPPEVQAVARQSDLHQPQPKRYKSDQTSSLPQQPPPQPYLLPVGYPNYPVTMVPLPPPPVINDALPCSQLWASLLAQSNDQIVEQGMQPYPLALPLGNTTEFNEINEQRLARLLAFSNQNFEQEMQPQPPALPMENATEFIEEGQPWTTSLLPLPNQIVEQGMQPHPLPLLPPLISNQNVVEQERRPQSPALPLENETELHEEVQPLMSLPPLSDQQLNFTTTFGSATEFFGARECCVAELS